MFIWLLGGWFVGHAWSETVPLNESHPDTCPDSHIVSLLPDSYARPITTMISNSSTPILCGGKGRFLSLNQPNLNCYSLLTGDVVATLQHERSDSVGFLTDTDTIWITGGTGQSITTEYVTLQKENSSSGPELPVGVWAHCFVRVNLTHGLLFGGYNIWNKTFLFDFGKKEWTRVGDMIHEDWKTYMACGALLIDQSEENIKVAVAAGGWVNSDKSLSKATEFWLPEKVAWEEGPDMPRGTAFAASVTSPDERTLFVIGGDVDCWGSISNAIFALKCFAMQCCWEVLVQELKTPRRHMAALIVTRDMIPCA